MAAAAAARDFLSPESTVTSLLASSGFLPPQLNTTIRYGYKDYESATEALEAYISDFDRSQHVGDTSTGRLILPSSPPTTPFRPRATLRNKDVLSERLSDRELDFLTLPVSSLRHHGDHDRLTMTTDELLAIPCDGSLPVTHTSALLSQSGVYPLEHSGLLSQSGAYLQGQTYLSHLLDQSTEPSSSARPRHRPERLRYSHTPCQHHPAPPRTTRTPRPLRSRERAGEAIRRHETKSSIFGPGASKQRNSKPPPPPPVPQATERETGAEPLGASPSPFHYPRWFTSQRSEMDCSGITSVPDLKYPAWIQDCDAVSQELYKPRGMPPAPRHRAPSWLGELESSDDELQQKGERTNTHLEEGVGVLSASVLREQFDPQKSLRELRLLLGEKTAPTSREEERRRDELDSRFRDDKIASLIQKAERVLSSSSLGRRGGGEDCALRDPASLGCTVPCNEEPARPEPNNDPIQYAKEAVTVSHVLNNDPIQHTKEALTVSPGNTEELLDAERSWENPPVTFKSPVPVGGVGEPEIFPEMLTDGRQEAHGSYPWGSSRRKHPGPVEALKQMLFTLQAMEVEHHPQQQPLTAGAQPEVEDFESAPGGQSLQRALHHLERLKSLVEEPKHEEGQRDQEKQNIN